MNARNVNSKSTPTCPSAQRQYRIGNPRRPTHFADRSILCRCRWVDPYVDNEGMPPSGLGLVLGRAARTVQMSTW